MHTEHLNTRSNIDQPDNFYEALIATHEGLSDEHSQLINAQLVLLLANHIGDMAVLEEALKAAKHSVQQHFEANPE